MKKNSLTYTVSSYQPLPNLIPARSRSHDRQEPFHSRRKFAFYASTFTLPSYLLYSTINPCPQHLIKLYEYTTPRRLSSAGKCVQQQKSTNEADCEMRVKCGEMSQCHGHTSAAMSVACDMFKLLFTLKYHGFS